MFLTRKFRFVRVEIVVLNIFKNPLFALLYKDFYNLLFSEPKNETESSLAKP